jgi:hypothetical protein
VNFKDSLANIPVTEFAITVGEDEPIIDVIINVDGVRVDVDDDDKTLIDDDAADDCVEEDAPLMPVDVSTAASGTVCASAEHAVLLAGLVPT